MYGFVNCRWSIASTLDRFVICSERLAKRISKSDQVWIITGNSEALGFFPTKQAYAVLS